VLNFLIDHSVLIVGTPALPLAGVLFLSVDEIPYWATEESGE
jgi:hypothetical protein